MQTDQIRQCFDDNSILWTKNKLLMLMLNIETQTKRNINLERERERDKKVECFLPLMLGISLKNDFLGKGDRTFV